MQYCYKCGNKINKTLKFCPNCGANLRTIKESGEEKGKSILGGLLALVALIGIMIGVFLLIGGLVANLMNPTIVNTSGRGRVWAIGYLIWSIFYPTGLISSCFVVGTISLAVGIGSLFMMTKCKDS